MVKLAGLLLKGKIVGQDYKRTIIWHAPAEIKVRFDKNENVIFEYQYGWPFEPVARGILTMQAYHRMPKRAVILEEE